MIHTFIPSPELVEGPVYLDCNATTPMEPEVVALVHRCFREDFGNAGSRTHEFGLRAKRLVQAARSQVANVVGASPEEVVFTSGATEANNLSILGLASHGMAIGRQHIIATSIEHKAVLEPLETLAARGFEVTLLKPDPSGAIDARSVVDALRPDTLLVSVMQVNNETGMPQPILDVAEALTHHTAYLHVDAAQGFGKELNSLLSPRIDLISVSSHKIHGPVGVGALIARRRNFKKPPLEPISYGGGQEGGLRPGTLPVALIAGFGLAAELAIRNCTARRERCQSVRLKALAAFKHLAIAVNGDLETTLPHVLNFSVEGLDSEAVIVALKDLVAVSNGSACTSHSYRPSHVLTSMGLTDERVAGAVRMSWCHMTPEVDWPAVAQRLHTLKD